jgi:glycosyltransferase involved in cell wall biosynthesis
MKRLDVRIVGPVFDIAGISNCVREAALALSESGIVTHLVNITNITPFKTTLDPQLQQRIDALMKTQISDNYVTIHMVPAEAMRLFDSSSKANICWTGYETDRLPFVVGLMMNDARLKEVWVPTQSNLNSFSGCGVNKDRLKVIPWGVDTTLYQPGNPASPGLREDGNFYFSFIGSLKASSGYDVVLKAFFEEFKNEPNVKLLFKAFLGNVPPEKEAETVKPVITNLKGDSKAEVVYIPGNLNTGDMAALYHTGDCLVSVPRAKTWNTSAIRSMAAGVPVITNINTGNRAYTNHQNAILIGSSQRRINDIDFLLQNPLQQEHNWFEPNLDELKAAMRKVYSGGYDLTAIRTAARREAPKHDWKRVTMEVIKNIKKYGEA